MSIKYINNCLNNEIIPDCFSYVIDIEDNIDYNKLNYNDHLTYEFYLKRFPPGFDSLPGYEKSLDSFIENNKDKTFLNEINKLKSNID